MLAVIRITQYWSVISTKKESSKINYLALGDSFISGEGAYNYQGGTDTDSNMCHLSLSAYPYLIGRDLSYDSYHSVACSGAKTDDITNHQDDYKYQASKRTQHLKDIPPLEIESIIATFRPGYVNQVDFVTHYQPKIINISIGGNDIGFSSIVTKCAAIWNIDNCYESYEDRLELVHQIDSKLPDLINTFTTIKKQSIPDARIYVIGYPQLSKASGDCALNVRLSDNEAKFSQLIINYLNDVIKEAATRTGAYYVDTEDALFGHRLCEAGPGSIAVNGLTAGTDFPSILNGLIKGPIGNESYHPNDTGHQLLENKILKVTNNFTTPMPKPTLSSSIKLRSNNEILDAPREGRPIYSIQFNDSMSKDVILRGSTFKLLIEGVDHSLKPLENYSAELHSKVRKVGEFEANTHGDIIEQVQIPADIPIGFHDLHVFGTNVADEAIDIYKTLYIAASENDFDGDGVNNESDLCAFIPTNPDNNIGEIDYSCGESIDKTPMGTLFIEQPIGDFLFPINIGDSRKIISEISNLAVRDIFQPETIPYQEVAEATTKPSAHRIRDNQNQVETISDRPLVLQASTSISQLPPNTKTTVTIEPTNTNNWMSNFISVALLLFGVCFVGFFGKRWLFADK